MKKRIRTLMALLCTAAISVSALAGCGSSGGEENESQQTEENTASAETTVYNLKADPDVDDSVTSSKDTLVIAAESDPGSADIHNSTTYSYVRVYATNTLMSQEYDENGSVQVVTGPESLATDYTIDEDGMGITFNIREGVTFQNGYPMTASDVVFSIKLYSDLSYFAYVDSEGVTAVDDYTVYVPFKTYDANALYSIGIGIPVYSEQYYNEMGCATDENALAEFYSSSLIGTGPYKITEWVSGDYVQYEAYEDYFAGTPKIPNLRVRFIQDASVAFMELQSGGVDIIAGSKGANWADVRDVMDGKYEGITCMQESGGELVSIMMNCSGALSDLNLRKAIATCMDRSVTVEGAYEGAETVAYTMVASNLPGVVDFTDSYPYEYDEEKAKEYLAEAGYEEGELTLKAIIGAGDTQRGAIAEILGSYMESIGVTLEIVSVDIATYADYIANQPQDWDIAVRSFKNSLDSGVISPHGFWTTSVPDNCHAEDQDTYAEMMDLATTMSQTLDADERNATFEELQNFYMNDCLYSIPVAEGYTYTVFNSDLKNWSKSGNDVWSVAFAYFE